MRMVNTTGDSGKSGPFLIYAQGYLLPPLAAPPRTPTVTHGTPRLPPSGSTDSPSRGE